MFKQIKRYTSSPAFENENKRRLAVLLQLFLLVYLVILSFTVS
jgi:hypothetical protein